MAVTLTKIDEYEVMYSANNFPPRIWLRNSGQYIGQLIFMPNGSALPADTSTGPNQVSLYYHLDSFHNAVDMLRNESPMYLLYAGPGEENGIKTTPEPIGEGVT